MRLRLLDRYVLSELLYPLFLVSLRFQYFYCQLHAFKLTQYMTKYEYREKLLPDYLCIVYQK